jgi:hypothetical protein
MREAVDLGSSRKIKVKCKIPDAALSQRTSQIISSFLHRQLFLFPPLVPPFLIPYPPPQVKRQTKIHIAGVRLRVLLSFVPPDVILQSRTPNLTFPIFHDPLGLPLPSSPVDVTSLSTRPHHPTTAFLVTTHRTTDITTCLKL